MSNGHNLSNALPLNAPHTQERTSMLHQLTFVYYCFSAFNSVQLPKRPFLKRENKKTGKVIDALKCPNAQKASIRA